MKRVLFLLLTGLTMWFGVRAEKPEPLELQDSTSWSMVLIPDPQTYSKFDYNHPLFELMMQWIKQNRQRLNIELVLCTGDLVEQNNQPTPNGINGNMPSTGQWQFISDAFGILDDVVPYILCTGNHDYGITSAENRYCQLNSYFPSNRQSRYTELLRGMFPNEAGVLTLENAWYEFTTRTGEKYLIVSMEFNPRHGVVEQVSELIARPQYIDHRVIYLTHSYLNAKGKLISKKPYKVTDVTCGKALWKQLIFPARNSTMVLCGHSVGELSHRGHVSFRRDTNAFGKPIPQMMFNAQAEGGGWHGNGGDGWLRVLEFHPDGKHVTVHTFSPLFGCSPSTLDQSLRMDDFDHFTFTIE